MAINQNSAFIVWAPTTYGGSVELIKLNLADGVEISKQKFKLFSSGNTVQAINLKSTNDYLLIELNYYDKYYAVYDINQNVLTPKIDFFESSNKVNLWASLSGQIATFMYKLQN